MMAESRVGVVSIASRVPVVWAVRRLLAKLFNPVPKYALKAMPISTKEK